MIKTILVQCMNGMDLTTVKELLGHKSLMMTMRYAHLAPGHKRKAVQVLDRIMDKNEDENLFLQIRNEYFAHLSARDLFKYLQMIEKDLLLENFL